MQKVVIYSKFVRNTSGVQTFERNLMKLFKDKYELIYMYEGGDPEILEEFSQYASMVKNHNQVVECNLCIYSSIYHAQNKIKANKYAQVVHLDLKDYDIKYSGEGIDYHIAVSENVQKILKEHYNLDSIVIPNMLAEPQIQKVLRLVTATRIAAGKGIERMITLAKRLKDLKIPFIWEIYGEGDFMSESNLKQRIQEIPEMIFLGPRMNVQSYMIGADYLVQLSDTEGFCYSVYEALQLGIPVIVRNWDGVQNIGIEGMIINGSISDVPDEEIMKIYTHIPAKFTFNFKNNLQSWMELIE